MKNILRGLWNGIKYIIPLAGAAIVTSVVEKKMLEDQVRDVLETERQLLLAEVEEEKNEEA